MGGVALGERRAAAPPSPPAPEASDQSLRRYTVASLVGLLVGAVPFAWCLLDMWTGSFDLLRKAGIGNFYDLQARTMIAGHLAVPKGQIGLEAFVHDGRQYIYFGILPSLLRIPVLLIDPGLTGRLTTPYMLVAWLLAGIFASLLLWRVRVLLRGDAVLSIGEAVSHGALLATITGGSVLVFLGATPWVYHEDLMWSVALSLATVFALVGVVERPSALRVWGLGFALLLTTLNRVTTGYACVGAVVLVALWFWRGRNGAEHRRWVLPLLVTAVVAFVASVAVNMAKFGIPVGLPMEDQVWTHLNAHRRVFLASNGGKYYGLKFLPAAALAYLQPLGVRFGTVFPFVSLPAAPAKTLGVIFDNTYQTASAPATMPLLLVLSAVGAFAVFRRKAVDKLKSLRWVLLCLCFPVAVTLVWGYLATRYLADFMPLLVLGAILGMLELWRRWDGRSRHGRPNRRPRIVAVAAILVLTVYGIVANVGISITPAEQWRQSQVVRYVQFQKSVGDLIGSPVTKDVVRGPQLPYWAPAGEIFIVGNCAGFYISTGQTFQNVPKQQLQHTTWQPIGEIPNSLHSFSLTLQAPPTSLPPGGVELFSIGTASVWMRAVDAHHVRFVLHDPRHPVVGGPVQVHAHRTYKIFVNYDVNRNDIHLAIHNYPHLNGVLTADGSIHVDTQIATGSGAPTYTVVDGSTSNGQVARSLCESLLKGTTS